MTLTACTSYNEATLELAAAGLQAKTAQGDEGKKAQGSAFREGRPGCERPGLPGAGASRSCPSERRDPASRACRYRPLTRRTFWRPR